MILFLKVKISVRYLKIMMAISKFLLIWSELFNQQNPRISLILSLFNSREIFLSALEFKTGQPTVNTEKGCINLMMSLTALPVLNDRLLKVPFTWTSQRVVYKRSIDSIALRPVCPASFAYVTEWLASPLLAL